MKEKLIKSKARVRERGEVFTPSWLVKDMCDLIPQSEWTIESRFLEPSCGNGNFLVEILDRKLRLCKDEKQGLKALNSIFGIDIMEDNVKESRARLMKMFLDAFPNANELTTTFALAILNNNIRCGNSLEIMKEWEVKQ
jgi:type I restriction-modification system DNA methylase subunit